MPRPLSPNYVKRTESRLVSVCMSTQFMTFCDVNRLPSIYGSLLRRLPSIYGSSTSLLRIFRTFGIDNREVIVNAHWPAVSFYFLNWVLC